ncbi:DNA repair photolyase [Novimethylophilus kurashikiensis]|uniref:DNA repair photolyase n=1 Tax=Novimethylophilus kurashikiensis TaxID=1825523 RepID=A0A2R5FBZ2_9PROT|nr:DNA repair photolyase [Novimethylophilus kurashikiensis]
MRFVNDRTTNAFRPLIFKGRGTSSNEVGRFEHLTREQVDDGWGTLDEDLPPLRTEVTLDATRSIINYNESPDIPFDRSINAYRGCEHGCVYCFARPSHAYLGLSPGLDFESKLFVKPDAAALLRKELAHPKYRCAPIAMGTNTDPYQPIERQYRATRQILEVLAECKHPVTIVTKSALIERDLDILGPMAKLGLAHAAVSVTTLDRTLSRHLEPRAAAPQRRLETIARLTEAGVPTTVMTAPMIPALNDNEMEAILEAAHQSGARSAAYVLLRLPHELVGLFEEWLQLHVPLKAEHVMSLIRQSRGGKAYDSTFHKRMQGEGLFAQMLAQRFRLAVKRLGLQDRSRLDTTLFQPPRDNSLQMDLF